MKIKITFTILFAVVFQYFGTSQIKIQNLSLAKPDTNVLYYGINKLKISGLKNISNVVIGLSGLYFYCLEDETFEVYPTVLGERQLKVYDSGKLIMSKTYNCFRLSEPVSYFGKYRDTSIMPNKEIIHSMVNVIIPESLGIADFTVTRFNATIISGTDTLYSRMKIEGNLLPPDAINNLKSNTTLFVDGITIKANENYPITGFYIRID